MAATMNEPDDVSPELMQATGVLAQQLVLATLLRMNRLDEVGARRVMRQIEAGGYFTIAINVGPQGLGVVDVVAVDADGGARVLASIHERQTTMN